MPFSTLRSRLTFSLYVRLTALVLSVIAIIMLAATVTINNNDDTLYADGWGPFMSGITLTGPCWTVLWCSIVLLLCLINHAYHPGADIAMDFLGWGLNWSFGILGLMWMGDLYFVDYQCNNSYAHDAGDCALAKKVTGLVITSDVVCLIVG